MSVRHLCDLHRQTVKRLGPQAALRFKQHGSYRDLSWNDYRQQADQAAAGLISLGVLPGDRVAILSENRAEWFIADHAVLSTGAADVPLHAPLATAQVEYQVGHSESRGIFVNGQIQADKVFSSLHSLPRLEFLICFEPVMVPEGCSLKVLSWEELKERGCHAGITAEAEIARREAAIQPNDLATIIYTSGTTGHPKGVMLSHHNLVSNAVSTGKISLVDPNDLLLSWLPYSHIYARTVDHYLTTWAGITVALAESLDTLVDDLAEIQPTWLTAVPRFYEKVWNNIKALPDAERVKKLQNLFGPRIKQLTSGGAPLPGHVCEAFFAAGLPLLAR